MPAMLAVIWVFFCPRIATVPERPQSFRCCSLSFSITATLAVGILLVLIPGHAPICPWARGGPAGGIASVPVFRSDGPPGNVARQPSLPASCFYLGMGRFIVRYRIQAFIVTLWSDAGVSWRILARHS